MVCGGGDGSLRAEWFRRPGVPYDDDTTGLRGCAGLIRQQADEGLRPSADERFLVLFFKSLRIRLDRMRLGDWHVMSHSVRGGGFIFF